MFSKKSIHNLTDSDYLPNHRGSKCKKSRGNTTVYRFLQIIRFHTQRKYGGILIAYDFPKQTVTALIIFDKNTKVMVH